jgi:hypothetical protein
MTPTAKLRWLELWAHGFGSLHPSAVPVIGDERRVRVLQQWWEDDLPTIVAYGTDHIETERRGEWRDIPIEGEA